MNLFLSGIDWPTVITTVLGSGLIAALCTAAVSWLLAIKQEENVRYEKLYGPLKFNLLMMKLMVENREEVLKDIKEYLNVEARISLMEKHMSPLTKQWIVYRDNIKKLFEQNAGLIKKMDFEFVSSFMDGCIKREITEEGRNEMAINESRTDKLLEAVKNFQERLL